MPESDLGSIFEAESGECEIDLTCYELRVRGASVPIGRRAFEILAVLVEAANETVDRDYLIERVWAGAAVGDGTIDVHISAIRKALGLFRGMLKTIPGRGHRLVGSWNRQNSN